MNFWDYIVLSLIALAVFAAIRHSVKSRQNSTGTCSGCCSGCSGCNVKDIK